MRLELTEGAIDYLAKQGYDPVYGARYISDQYLTGCSEHLFAENSRTGVSSFGLRL